MCMHIACLSLCICIHSIGVYAGTHTYRRTHYLCVCVRACMNTYKSFQHERRPMASTNSQSRCKKKSFQEKLFFSEKIIFEKKNEKSVKHHRRPMASTHSKSRRMYQAVEGAEAAGVWRAGARLTWTKEAVLQRCVCQRVSECVCVCVCVHYIYIYIYTHTHTHIHQHTHTPIYRRSSSQAKSTPCSTWRESGILGYWKWRGKTGS